MRIPRDWYGPKDELVPFGPRAAEEGVGEASPLDASTFWGEDADSIQGVLEPSLGAVGRGRRVAARMVIASLAMGVIALVGLATWVLESSHQTRSLPKLALTSPHEQTAASQLRLAKVFGDTLKEHRGRPRDRHQQKIRPKTRVPAHATEVVYRTSGGSTSGSASTASGGTTPSEPAPISPAPTNTDQTSAASTASATQTSQPAFGSSGALGAMSSPDG